MEVALRHGVYVAGGGAEPGVREEQQERTPLRRQVAGRGAGLTDRHDRFQHGCNVRNVAGVQPLDLAAGHLLTNNDHRCGWGGAPSLQGQVSG